MLVQAYSHLQKKGTPLTGQGAATFWVFAPLRAAGLAVEAAHKAAEAKGRNAVTWRDVCTVEVAGELLVLDDGCWRKLRKCTLRLEEKDAKLAVELLGRQRSLLAGLKINIWKPDVRMPGKLGSYDLLCDFSTDQSFGVKGRLWVELKQLSAATFASQVANIKEHLEEKFPKVHRLDSSVGGVLLLAASVPKEGRAWGAPVLAAWLWSGSGGWKCLVKGPPTRVARGQCKVQKPPLEEVFQSMAWMKVPRQAQKVGLVSHFLKKLKLPRNNVGKRCETFNTLFQRERLPHRLEQKEFDNFAGQDPWVGTASVFESLYQFL